MDDELTDYGRVSGEQLTNWGEDGLKKGNVALFDGRRRGDYSGAISF
ncbi:hypothetical protein MYX84_03610 [Acidobacteria bacterium AH-259-O06]|nr:hypothetical protein [Acidobacteria bacterium AH-259-O06]